MHHQPSSAWNPLAWLTVLTAATAVWIAYQQYRTARHKLKLDLFDRRMLIYEAAKNILQKIVRDATIELNDVMAFGYETRHAEFLFEKELVTYIATMREKAIRLRQLKGKLFEGEMRVDENRTELVNEEAGIIMWFLKQLEEGLNTQFASYLSFRNVK